MGDQPLAGDRVLLESLGEARAQALALYDGYGTDDNELVALEMAGDLGQVHRTRGYAQLLVATGQPIYLYHFSYVTDARRDVDPAARHETELPYVFNTVGALEDATERNREVARQMSAYWVQFAKTGDPNGGDLSLWPATSDGNALMEFTLDGRPVARQNFESEKMAFWDALYDTGWRYPPIQDEEQGEEEVETPASTQIPSSSPQ